MWLSEGFSTLLNGAPQYIELKSQPFPPDAIIPRAPVSHYGVTHHLILQSCSSVIIFATTPFARVSTKFKKSLKLTTTSIQVSNTAQIS